MIRSLTPTIHPPDQMVVAKRARPITRDSPLHFSIISPVLLRLSRQQPLHHRSMHIRESEITPLETIGQLGVIHPK